MNETFLCPNCGLEGDWEEALKETVADRLDAFGSSSDYETYGYYCPECGREVDDGPSQNRT